MSSPSPLHQLGRNVFVALGVRSEHKPTSVGPVHLWRMRGAGTLPPVLLFHGFGASGMHWIPLMQGLSRRVRECVAVDLPAHGFSAKPDGDLTQQQLLSGAVEALDQIDLEPALVIGNSLGGAAGLRYLHARPERARAAMLFSPAGAPMSEEELAALRALFAIEAHGDAVRFVRALPARPPGLTAHLIAPLLRGPLADPLLRRWLERVAPEDFLTADEIATVPRPIQVIWGKQERILPGRAREFWRAHLPPHSSIIEPEGLGHSPFLDKPLWMIREILKYAETLALSAA